MASRQEIFKHVFCSNENGNGLNITSSERSVAELIYACACNTIQEDFDDKPVDPDDEPGDDDGNDLGDDDSVSSFDEKIETAMENFERVVELFKLSSKAKKEFLESFDDWSSLRESIVNRLKDIAGKIQTDKFNSDIAKVIGGVVGILGGIVAGLSLLTPLAVVTVPLAIGGGVTSAVGGGVVVGTLSTEVVLLKNKLEEAKTLVEQDMESFSPMAKWFTHTGELKAALESLIDFNLLNEMSEDLRKFNDEVKDDLDSVRDRFGEVLSVWIGKMVKRSQIVEMFGTVLAPVVMTFVLVVCLMRDYNRFILQCIVGVDRIALAVGLMGALDIGVQAGRLGIGLMTKGTAAAGRTVATVATSALVALGVAFDIVNVVLASIDIHNCPEVEQAKQIKEAALKLEEEFSFIKSVHDELEKSESIDWSLVFEWKTFIISHVPLKARIIDIKMAVKPHLSEEAWGCIKLQRYTDENHWLVKIPAGHSQMLLRQSHLVISGENCQITQWTAWKTFIILHVPDDAGQEDIKRSARHHLPEEAWDDIKLQKLSTGGNNWLLKVPDRHSQNLARQSHISIKEERCLVTQ